MYRIGDKVMHRREGACRIKQVVEMKVNQESKEYFLLTPLLDLSSVIYVSTDAKKQDSIRPIIRSNDFTTAQSELQKNPLVWIENSRQRMQELNKLMSSFEFEKMFLTLMCLNDQNKKNKLKNKDAELYKNVQKMVYSELALLWDIEYDKIAASQDLC